MESILDIHIKNREFCHGYLLAGDFDLARKTAIKSAEVLLGCKEGLLGAHPDFSHQKFDLFGVEEGLSLRKWAGLRPFMGERKVFIMEISYFSIEAANSLLKTFEEPAQGTHFFLIINSADDLPPTLCSRLVLVNFSSEIKQGGDERIFCEKFLKEIPSERLNMIKKFLGKDFSQNKIGAIKFLNGLEIIFAENKKIKALEEIQKNREFLYTRSPSIKMILEHLALVLPKI